MRGAYTLNYLDRYHPHEWIEWMNEYNGAQHTTIAKAVLNTNEFTK